MRWVWGWRGGVPVGVCLALALSGMIGAATPAFAEEPRPQAAALRLGENDVLARFTSEVRRTPLLRERALALWRTHFQSLARQLIDRLYKEEDWRPVLADAGELVDEYLEASLLPRAGRWPVAGEENEKVWVEKLDPQTGQRMRVMKRLRRSDTLFAPKD